jgi:ABC-2 type transport system permease protein
VLLAETISAPATTTRKHMTDIVEERAAVLAQQPMRPASPRPGFARGTATSLRDVLAHRELLGLLVRRELKARYKDSALGFVWSLVRPLVLLLIYYVALGQFLGAARQIDSFAIFIYSGLTAWTLWSEIVSVGTSSIVANAGLIKKVYLPREVFPLSVVGSALFGFCMQLIILVGATLVARQFPVGTRWGWFFLSLAVLLVWGLALALVLSATNVYLRDIQYLVEVCMQVFFWLSPIVYSWKLVHGVIQGTVWETIYLLNPMTLVTLGFQRAFWVAGDGTAYPPDLESNLWLALGVGVLALWLCQRVFARLQANFAQEL